MEISRRIIFHEFEKTFKKRRFPVQVAFSFMTWYSNKVQSKGIHCKLYTIKLGIVSGYSSTCGINIVEFFRFKYQILPPSCRKITGRCIEKFFEKNLMFQVLKKEGNEFTITSAACYQVPSVNRFWSTLKNRSKNQIKISQKINWK